MNSNTGLTTKAKIIRALIMFMMVTASAIVLFTLLSDGLSNKGKFVYLYGFNAGLVLGLGVFFSYKFSRDYYDSNN